MNHDGHLIIAQAQAPNSAPTSYTTSRDTILKEAVQSVSAALNRMAEVRAAFRSSYRRMLALAAASQQPLAVCTIYDAIPTLDHGALCAIGLFNDVIIREAALAGIPVIDLRAICTLSSDYSRISPIEPSASGGGKIAGVIASVLTMPADAQRALRCPRSFIMVG